PFGFGHLFPELADHRRHLPGDAAGNDHEIGLTRRRTKYFGAEARNIKTGSAHGHHLNGATGQAKSHRPDRALAHPVDHVVQRGHDYSLRLLVAEQQLFHPIGVHRIAASVLEALDHLSALHVGSYESILHDLSIVIRCPAKSKDQTPTTESRRKRRLKK